MRPPTSLVQPVMPRQQHFPSSLSPPSAISQIQPWVFSQGATPPFHHLLSFSLSSTSNKLLVIFLLKSHPLNLLLFPFHLLLPEFFSIPEFFTNHTLKPTLVTEEGSDIRLWQNFVFPC